jgi:uncharacterized protein YdhG (YjbR/CyaY superfamily)
MPRSLFGFALDWISAVHWPLSISFCMPKKPSTIDAYLAALTPEHRALLERLRRAVHRRLTNAEECISYGMPAFRIPGGIVGGFAATKQDYSYYPFSGQTLTELAETVSVYKRTKSALHFTAKQPLPTDLLRKLSATRLAEIRRKRPDPAQYRRSATLADGACNCDHFSSGQTKSLPA